MSPRCMGLGVTKEVKFGVSKKHGIGGHQEGRHQGITAKLGRGSPLRRVGLGSESSAGSGVAGKGGDKPPRSPRPRLSESRKPRPGEPGPTRAGERDSGQGGAVG